MHINSRAVVRQQFNRLHYCRYKPTVNKVHAVSHSEGGDDAIVIHNRTDMVYGTHFSETALNSIPPPPRYGVICS